MLKATPNGWFSNDFTVYDRTCSPVAEMDLANWRESVEIQVGQKRYLAHRQGWRSKEFVLEDSGVGGEVVAVAEKPSGWKNAVLFEHGATRYELKKASTWRSSFVVSREGVGVVGSVERSGMLKKREYLLDVPEELPLEVRVFVSWLALILWQREDSAAASSGSGGG
jgi:hypothetical protein